jgi:WD40-like Beta Propeller Repeat
MAAVGQPGARALTATPAAEVGVSVAPDGRRLLIARAMIVRDHAGLFSGYERPEIILAEIGDDRMNEIAVRARGDAERGDPSSPAWSPDGQRFVYAREARGRGLRNDLYVMNADGSDDRLLVRGGALVAWAADGRSIYYQARTRTDIGGEVRLIGIDGRGDRLVLADTYVPARSTLDAQWNQRRDRLAISTQALVGVYDASGFRAPTGIVLLNEEGAVQRDLREAGRTDIQEGGVQWDARDRLVFARHTAVEWRGHGPRGGIFTLDPASGDERTILADTETYSE